VRVYKRKPKAKPFIGQGQRALIKSERHAVRLFGADLQDAREEAFIRMVCDGLSLGTSYARAGFTSKAQNAARDLFNRPHVQRRAEAVLEARRTQGVVTLPEVTDMLKRVFAGANSEGEYSAAHNAAFSLARLYGHVTDKATLEVLRKPSREPDAPSEQVLGDWVASLPGPTIEAQALPSSPEGALKGPLRCAPAPLLGLDLPRPEPSDRGGAMLSAYNSASPEGSGLEGSGLEGSGLEGSGLGAARRDGRMEIENGAPTRPVTGTPTGGGRAVPLVVSRETKPPTPVERKRVPSKAARVPVKKRVKSGAEKRKARKLKLRAEMKDLFG
jgi:hypothetical protein